MHSWVSTFECCRKPSRPLTQTSRVLRPCWRTFPVFRESARSLLHAFSAGGVRFEDACESERADSRKTGKVRQHGLRTREVCVKGRDGFRQHSNVDTQLCIEPR